MGWEDQDRDELGRWGTGGGGAAGGGEEGSGGRPLTAQFHRGAEPSVDERNPRRTTPGARSGALRDVDDFTSGKLEQMGAEGRMLDEFELMRVTEAISDHLEGDPEVLAALKATSVGDRDLAGGEDRYTLSLHESEHLSVYLLRWGPDQQAEWHDHGDGEEGARVAVRVLDGPVANDFLSTDGEVETLEMNPGRTYYLPAPYVHRMGDFPEDRGAAWSVHAYSGPRGGLDKMTWYDFDPATNELTLKDGKPVARSTWEREARTKLYDASPPRAVESRGAPSKPLEAG